MLGLHHGVRGVGEARARRVSHRAEVPASGVVKRVQRLDLGLAYRIEDLRERLDHVYASRHRNRRRRPWAGALCLCSGAVARDDLHARGGRRP